MTKQTIEQKTFEELTPEDFKDIKIEFVPGCFDSFEGTQEELDELIAEITRMIRSGSFESQGLDIDELMEEDPVTANYLQNLSNPPTRTLQ